MNVTIGGKSSKGNYDQCKAQSHFRDQDFNGRYHERGQGHGRVRGVQCLLCGKNRHVVSTCLKLKNLLSGSPGSQSQNELASSAYIALGNGGKDNS